MINQNSIKKYQTIIIGVSGGIDSMALIFFICKNKLSKQNVIVVHINYKTRGYENEIEQQIVKNFCTENNIKLHVFNFEKNQTNENFQKQARDFRYKKFQEVYKNCNADVLFSAHNLNDKVETYFIKRIQKRDKSNNSINQVQKINSMNVFRPLLNTTRNQIEKYVFDNNINYNFDSSNNNSKYLRNKIRKKLNKIIKSDFQWQKLSKKIESREQNSLINEEIIVSKFNKVKHPESLVHQFLLDNEFIIRNRNIEYIIEFINSNTKQILFQDKYIYKENDRLHIYKNISKEKEFIKINDNIDKIMFNQVTIINKNKLKNFIIRYKKSGDIVNINNQTKSLKKLLIDKKIPQCKRNDLIVIEQNHKIIFIQNVFNNDLFCISL